MFLVVHEVMWKSYNATNAAARDAIQKPLSSQEETSGNVE